ncbi:MAG: pyruvate ferredoxin oxidoreductase [Firmicutes bacterium]|jgi:pyruvate ferredoxin oxidoreductase alpha subunit|nr:pyruvate ferredoxin oxidoreductase [Bacillota bacterium]MDD4336228.1 pyruvate ferredoxin oxidoreductase [Bacillota bacterium]MDD4791925.1 pyruvate ferredoxin oxidoreductase [Bacillota bacterium]
MSIRVGKTGNEAVAEAMRQINPDVVAAYPITPQTEIVQIFSSFVANGKVDTEFVTVESEHSAMSATVGAASAGARSMTATSANGLAFMWEIVYIAAGMRLPIVMPVVNRALSGPLNIHCDHSDTMGARDSGWIQLFSENAQEAYDNAVQAPRIAENPDVKLPVMVTMDGFIISHAMEVMEILEDEKVREFIGKYVPENPLLDVDNPVTLGPVDLQDWNFEHKRQQAEAMRNAKPVILDVASEYAKLTGRKYGLFEEYKLDDADIAIVVLGSTAGTAKVAVNALRAKGVRAGMLKMRVFRPFPAEEIADALKHVKAVAVMDRSDSFNAVGGPVFVDVRSALYDVDNGPKIVNYIYGIGGRDVTPDHVKTVYADLAKIAETGQVENPLTYLGIRE